MIPYDDCLCAGLPSLLGKNGVCDPPLYLSPVADQQRMSNMSAVLAKLASVGAVPPEGQVCAGGWGSAAGGTGVRGNE